MKTADSPTIAAARVLLTFFAHCLRDEEVALSAIEERFGAEAARNSREQRDKIIADTDVVLARLKAEVEEAQIDNGRWQIQHACSLCQCDDLPLVFCSGPYGTTLRCSDCSNHLRYEPIPLWGDYCGGAA